MTRVTRDAEDHLIVKLGGREVGIDNAIGLELLSGLARAFRIDDESVHRIERGIHELHLKQVRAEKSQAERRAESSAAGCVEAMSQLARMRETSVHMPNQATAAEMARIYRERRRQVGGEIWSTAHDDEHIRRELAAAAACYAWVASLDAEGRAKYAEHPPENFPWAPKWWKPKSWTRDLIRAAALIVAELERRRRAGDPATCQECGGEICG